MKRNTELCGNFNKQGKYCFAAVTILSSYFIFVNYNQRSLKWTDDILLKLVQPLF